jgi:hypothetical protein
MIDSDGSWQHGRGQRTGRTGLTLRVVSGLSSRGYLRSQGLISEFREGIFVMGIRKMSYVRR